MAKQRNRFKGCQVCGRATNNAFICRRCANECHDLLVGSREADGQPGVVWYVKRLRESAYGQTRMGRSMGARTSREGYSQLGNQRAFELLTRIASVLARWEAVCDRLRSTHSHETPVWHMGVADRRSERLDASRARFIAAHVVLIRHHRPDAGKLHDELYDIAIQAWRIINRPDDICCGGCPTMYVPKGETREKQCGTLLYAEESAATVQCHVCRRVHNVEALRDSLKHAVRDMLFSRAELVKLMETRLNDRIPQPTFTKLLRDGRLRPRKVEDGTSLFTYNDVCEARAKPVPEKRTATA